MKQTFQAKITGRGPNSAWIQVDIPFDVYKTLGSKGLVPVAGTVNGFPFRNSLNPMVMALTTCTLTGNCWPAPKPKWGTW